jgi:hypothetical protein
MIFEVEGLQLLSITAPVCMGNYDYIAFGFLPSQQSDHDKTYFRLRREEYRWWPFVYFLEATQRRR